MTTRPVALPAVPAARPEGLRLDLGPLLARLSGEMARLADRAGALDDAVAALAGSADAAAARATLQEADHLRQIAVELQGFVLSLSRAVPDHTRVSLDDEDFRWTLKALRHRVLFGWDDAADEGHEDVTLF